MKKLVTIYVKLPSIPAVVTMKADGDPVAMLAELRLKSLKCKKIGSDILVVEE